MKQYEVDIMGIPMLPVKRGIAKSLWAYDGGDKPQKQEVVNASTQHKGVKQASFGSDFGSGMSAKNQMFDSSGKALKGQFSLDTTTKLADFLQPIPGMAGQGVQNNLSFLNRSPQQQFDDAVGGNNPLYNLLAEKTKRDTDAALGRSLVDNQGTGTMNSTTAGAAQGMILNDQILRSNNDLLQAISFGNEQGRANLGTNLNALGSMANLVYPLGSAANANLMQSFNAQDQVALANAQAQNQANAAHTQAMNQWTAQNPSHPLGAYGKFIDPLGFATNPAKATGQFASIAGAAFGGPLGGVVGGSMGGALGQGGFNTGQGLYQPNFGSTSLSIA